VNFVSCVYDQSYMLYTGTFDEAFSRPSERLESGVKENRTQRKQRPSDYCQEALINCKKFK